MSSIQFNYLFLVMMILVLFNFYFFFALARYLSWVRVKFNRILPILVHGKNIWESEAGTKYFIMQGIGWRFLVFSRLVLFYFTFSWEILGILDSKYFPHVFSTDKVVDDVSKCLSSFHTTARPLRFFFLSYRFSECVHCW